MTLVEGGDREAAALFIAAPGGPNYTGFCL